MEIEWERLPESSRADEVNFRPTTASEKKICQQNMRKESRTKKYLSNLRKAFIEADVDKKGALSEEQWLNSSLRFFIRDGKLDSEAFVNYFHMVDANKDGDVSWDELVNFLILDTHSPSQRERTGSTPTFERQFVSQAINSNRHRESITQILFSNWTNEFITLSRDSVRFWKPNPFTFSKLLNHKGPFSCACLFTNYPHIAIALSSRKLLFFSLATLEQFPIEVAASPSHSVIKQMKIQETEEVLTNLTKASMPLFNQPTCITEAKLMPPKNLECSMIVCDDCGYVEIFVMRMPNRRLGKDYSIVRVANKRVHQQSVTKIEVIEDLGVYATSSLDGTVKFFNFYDDSIKVTAVFNEDDPVSSFCYVPSQKQIVICSPGHDAYVWSVHPPKRSFRLGAGYNSATHIVRGESPSGEPLLIALMTRKEFRVFDCIHFTLVSEWRESELLYPDDSYTALYFDYTKSRMVSCCGTPVIWIQSETNKPQGVTHKYPIVGIQNSLDFGFLISVDSNGFVYVWDYKTGKILSHKQLQTTELSAAVLDQPGRRIITSDYKGQIRTWNYNSGGIISNVQTIDKVQRSIVIHTKMQNRFYLITAGWSRLIYLYIEIAPSKFEFFQCFNQHLHNVNAIACHPDGYVFTGSIAGEIVMWSIDASSGHRQNVVDDETPIEHLEIMGTYLLAVDSNGMLTILEIPSVDIVYMVKAHDHSIPYSLSTVQQCGGNRFLTGDTLGYVRLWYMHEGGTVEGYSMVRCHVGELTDITVIGDSGFFATAGHDMAVRLWGVDSMALVGTFSSDLWTIKEMDTWSTDVLPDDPRIENKKARSISVSPSRCTISMKSSLSVRLKSRIFESSASLLSTRQTSEVDLIEGEKPIDWEAARVFLELASSSDAPVQDVHEPPETVDEKPRIRRMELLDHAGQNTDELFAEINRLRGKRVPRPTDDLPESKKEDQPRNQTRADTLKAMIVHNPKQKPRRSLTQTFVV